MLLILSQSTKFLLKKKSLFEISVEQAFRVYIQYQVQSTLHRSTYAKRIQKQNVLNSKQLAMNMRTADTCVEYTKRWCDDMITIVPCLCNRQIQNQPEKYTFFVCRRKWKTTADNLHKYYESYCLRFVLYLFIVFRLCLYVFSFNI